jgi:hypothetical protein
MSAMIIFQHRFLHYFHHQRLRLLRAFRRRLASKTWISGFTGYGCRIKCEMNKYSTLQTWAR